MRQLRHPNRRRGSNLIEFALILPVAVVMFFGIFEHGWYVYQSWAVKRLMAVALGLLSIRRVGDSTRLYMSPRGI